MFKTQSVYSSKMRQSIDGGLIDAPDIVIFLLAFIHNV